MILLYIHGMGGGGDSRIPGILRARLRGSDIETVVRTYSFDPDEGAAQIAAWVEELSPSIIVGESLGSLQALRIHGLPHIFVSPSLGAPSWLGGFAVLSLIPGVRPLLNRVYKPREGDRQPLDFRYGILRKYRAHGREALGNSPRKGSDDYFFAFFGHHDHYRRSGVVSVRKWERWFGKDNYAMYDGTHFMEEEFIDSLLLPKIKKIESKCSADSD